MLPTPVGTSSGTSLLGPSLLDGNSRDSFVSRSLADVAEVSSCPHPESEHWPPPQICQAPAQSGASQGPGTAAGPEQTGQSPHPRGADCPVQPGPALPTGPRPDPGGPAVHLGLPLNSLPHSLSPPPSLLILEQLAAPTGPLHLLPLLAGRFPSGPYTTRSRTSVHTLPQNTCVTHTRANSLVHLAPPPGGLAVEPSCCSLSAPLATDHPPRSLVWVGFCHSDPTAGQWHLFTE